MRVNNLSALAFVLSKQGQKGIILSKTITRVMHVLKDVKDSKTFFEGISITQVNQIAGFLMYLEDT